jgi:hypothetical protein
MIAGWIDLGECKWGAVSSVPTLISELEEKLRRYPNPDNATVGRMLFTRRPLRSHASGVRHFCLDDLYELAP